MRPLSPAQEAIVEAGLRAYRRTQQKLTDRQDREQLHALIKQAGPDGLVLDARYGIRIHIWENAPKGWGQSDLFEEGR